jgi:hypothetical protein
VSLSKFQVKKPDANVAERGKWGEGEVRKALVDMAKADAHFTFNRVLDARSAGGKFPGQVGDFQWFTQLPRTTLNGVIEVKEVEHAKLLPFKNLSTDSFARMKVRQLAGSRILVLVAHRYEEVVLLKGSSVGMSVALNPAKSSSVTVWRALPLSAFADRSVGGSWDLSYSPPVDFKQALRDLLKV